MIDKPIFEKAIEVLRLTNDGSELTAQDLALVGCIINSSAHSVSELHEVAFDELHSAVTAGRYVPALHGIEHLTIDHQGYVYWKGQNIEHYSFKDKTAEKQAAIELAKRCRMLEEKGFPVNARSVLDRKFEEAPADTPWLKLLQKVYSVSLKDGVLRWIILATPGDNAVAISKPEGALVVRQFTAVDERSGCYQAFHELNAEGFGSGSAFTSGYTSFIAAVEGAGFTPSDIDQAIA
jgi:hypothetical protein